MFCCISPVTYNVDETFCTLNFASRVGNVELGKASKQVVGGGASIGSGRGQLVVGVVGKPAKRARRKK